jgi:hypothetical protein
MVVYGSSYGAFGHIATVVAVEPGRYEVVEQNSLDFDRTWSRTGRRSMCGRSRGRCERGGVGDGAVVGRVR